MIKSPPRKIEIGVYVNVVDVNAGFENAAIVEGFYAAIAFALKYVGSHELEWADVSCCFPIETNMAHFVEVNADGEVVKDFKYVTHSMLHHLCDQRVLDCLHLLGFWTSDHPMTFSFESNGVSIAIKSMES